LLCAAIVNMNIHGRAESCDHQLIDKRRVGARSYAVVELKWPTKFVQSMGHRQNWRNANTASDEHTIFGTLPQSESITGSTHQQP
jgi:hypothetical protein